MGEPCRVSPRELARLFGWTGSKAKRRSSIAVSALPAARASGGSGRLRPQVLFGMAHAGFFRNFEGVVTALLEAGLDVYVHYSKAHDTITPDDYHLVLSASAGRLTHSIAAARAGEAPLRAQRLRLVRDILFYSRPQYREATDLRARFLSLQKSYVLATGVQRLIATVVRWLPAAAKEALDAALARMDERLEPHPGAASLLETLRPACVIVTPLVNFASREVDLLKAARRRRIPTLLATASWDNLTNKGRIKIQPDRIAVWNSAMAQEATELHGIPADRIWITGAPVFDPWFNRAPSRSRDAFFRMHGFDESRPLIVYLCSSQSIAGYNEHTLVKEWLGAMRASDRPVLSMANLLIRPHPMAPGWDEAVRDAEEPTPASSDGGAIIWPVDPDHPTTGDSRSAFFDTLYHADAVVGLNTSAMIEAAILSRPVLTFLGHERAESQAGNLHFRHLTNSGAVRVAANLDEHLAQLATVLDGVPEVAAACDRFVESFVRPYGRDVAASATLADMILLEMGFTAGAAQERALSMAGAGSA